jgi:hypothetical protein
VFLPFVRQSRTWFDKWVPNTPIPDELSSVSWCDGDLAQIATIVEEDTMSIYSTEKICVNKQNAARSGTEQAADLTTTFKMLHKLQRKVSLADIYSDDHGLKFVVEHGFRNLAAQGKLRLRPNKTHALVDFISSVPQILSQAATPANIRHGFVANGMADPKTKAFPDYDALLATCRKSPTISEYELTKKSFPKLIQHQFDHGHIPDTLLEDLGFPKDRDFDGKEVRRDATITQEARQRAKCLTHEHQMLLRKELILKRLATEKAKEAQNAINIQQLLEQNKECEERLLRLLQDADSGITKNKRRKQAPAPVTGVIVPPAPLPMVVQPSIPGPNSSSLPFDRLTLEMMVDCCLNPLKSFIRVRECENMDKTCKLPKNKGSLELAREKEDECVLGWAYNVRNKPVIMKLPVPSEAIVLSPQPIQRYQNATIVQWGHSSSIVPVDATRASVLLARPEWISRVLYCFSEDRQLEEISNIAMDQADLLQTILLQRLDRHISNRVQNKEKHSHWCWNWARQNLGHIAAIMTVFRHSKMDVSHGWDPTVCLLSGFINFWPASNELANLEGCYLYYDSNDNEWIRSGKVTNRSFQTRHAEHARAARLTTTADTASTFYTTYPSSASAHIGLCTTRKGHFEKLMQYVGVGFNRKKDHVERYLTTCVDAGDGVFAFDGTMKERCGRVNFKGTKMVGERQIHFVAYLCELGYDLALSSTHNISRSPGFETPLGNFRDKDSSTAL